jgi:hypothetical protein
MKMEQWTLGICLPTNWRPGLGLQASRQFFKDSQRQIESEQENRATGMIVIVIVASSDLTS